MREERGERWGFVSSAAGAIFKFVWGAFAKEKGEKGNFFFSKRGAVPGKKKGFGARAIAGKRGGRQ